MAGRLVFRRRLNRESFDFSALNQNPLSLGGRVTNGLAVGLDWNNMQSVSGKGATGTAAQITPPYQDNICTIDPPAGVSAWSQNQELISRVFVQNKGSFGQFHEVEHLLRFTIEAHVAKGYEIIFSLGPTNYIEIAEWSGDLHNPPTTVSVTSLANSNIATAPSIDNGHYVRSVIEGNIIRAYHKTTLGGSWTLYAEADITNRPIKYTGKIGVGNWDNDNGGAGGQYDDYGLLTLDVAA